MRRQIDTLTSLRFFAAFAVLIFHVPYTMPQAWSVQYFSQGAYGIGFFFVLSGFVLAHAHQARPFSIADFYRGRIARIYPLHIITFAIWTLLFFASWGAPLDDKIQSGLLNVLLLQSWFPGQLFTLGYNAVSWSLSVGLLFYALFPVVRRPLVALIWFIFFSALCAIAPTSVIDVINAHHPSFFNFFPLARLSEFCIGIMTFHLLRNVRISRAATVIEIGAVVIACAGIWQIEIIPIQHRYVACGLLFAIVVGVFSKEAGLLSVLLGAQSLILLGNASFAIYMLHHMTFNLIGINGGFGLNGEFLFTLALSAVILTSIALHTWVEIPLRKMIFNSPSE